MRTERVETAVKLVFESILPGAEMLFRDEQSHGEYDFDLHYPNGTLAAIEVTESTDQLQEWTSAKIRSKKEGGPIIEARHCKKSWVVRPMKDAGTISVIRNKADGYLAKVEKAGFENFKYIDAQTARRQREAGLDRFRPPRVPRCVEDICYDLKIMSGWAISAEAPSRIFISHPIGSGAVGPNTPVKAGKRESEKEDNREKLGAAKTDERHLAVYMNGLPWYALTTFEPPSAFPELPEEITHIWLIGHSGEANKPEFIVWGASKNEPWRSHVVVAPQTNPPARR
jgi:hypothetical protein